VESTDQDDAAGAEARRKADVISLTLADAPANVRLSLAGAARALGVEPRDRVGQIAATVGLTVLEQAGLEVWNQLKALGLVEYGDKLIVKEILAAG
jgi:hypothetical protein